MYKKRIKASESKFFVGEMMTCSRCGKKKKSDPAVSSGWTVIEVDNVGFYICRECFEDRSLGDALHEL